MSGIRPELPTARGTARRGVARSRFDGSVFPGEGSINRGSTAEYLKPAEAVLERALRLDPNNVDALAAKGWVDMDLGAGFMTDDHPARLASAEATAIKAL